MIRNETIETKAAAFIIKQRQSGFRSWIIWGKRDSKAQAETQIALLREEQAAKYPNIQDRTEFRLKEPQSAAAYPVEVLTGGYENSHGKRPRGEGSWAFSLGSNESLEALFWFNGKYGEAVKAAKEAARAVGQRFVRVQP